MSAEQTNLPALPSPLPPPVLPAARDALAAIPEEEIWLAKQKSARTRRAYRLDLRHFMRSLGISKIEQLRAIDHGEHEESWGA
jgi:integrase/recombinase XerD